MTGSNSTAVDKRYEALSLVLSRLSPRELAHTRLVCRSWREAACSTEVRRASFIQHWRLGGLVGDPRNPALMDTASPAHFVRRHRVTRTDTLTALAVRHGCGVTAIKRLNNLISDHSLHSRAAVFIPVSSTSELVGSVALFEYCRTACRELLVLLSYEEAEAARRAMQDQNQQQPRPGEGSGDEAGGTGAAPGCKLSPNQQEALQGKLAALLSRSMHLDDATARFYLAEAGWCLKQAVALCEQDLQWEIRSPGGRRRGSQLVMPRKRG